MPLIDGVPLLERIREFEVARTFDVPGQYGPLIPAWFQYPPWDAYWKGTFEPDSYFALVGANYVLACDCGEVGCWPLECRIAVEGETVCWDRFRQPHRPERDYSAFGPFVFELRQYEGAIAGLIERLA